MSNRIANIIVLCEDQEQANFARRYLVRAGHEARAISVQPLAGSIKCGSQYVREQMFKQVSACRGILGRKTNCLLLVLTDADNLSVAEREETLHDALRQAQATPLVSNEPIVLLIPKWQIESWVKCLMDMDVTENDKLTDQPPVTAKEIKAASEVLFNWTRANYQVPLRCIPSLEISIPRWKRCDL